MIRRPPRSTLFPTRRSSDLVKSWSSFVGSVTENRWLSASQTWLRPMHGTPLLDPLPKAERERSEEHTSELQSLAYLVCRLLLEKKHTSYSAVAACARLWPVD